MVKSVCMKNYSCSMFLLVSDSLEFSFKSTNPSNISITDVNVTTGVNVITSHNFFISF